MQSSAAAGSGQRAPGAFNPNTSSTSSINVPPQGRQPGRIPSLTSSPVPDATTSSPTRLQRSRHVSPERPQLQSSPFAQNSRYPALNSSTPNLNYSRPSASYIGAATSARASSPLRLQSRTSSSDFRQRKQGNFQGYFEPSLPNAGLSNFGAMESPQYQQQALTASQIAAQAAMQHQSHQRKRSQTIPVEQGQRRPSRGPVSPPLLSVTEASGERQNGFGQGQYGASSAGTAGQIYRNGLIEGSVNPAATAASVVFARSPLMSPNLPNAEAGYFREPEKPVKPEKSKAKLFSRPGKLTGLGKDKESKEKVPSSPSKLGFHAQQPRANASAMSLAGPNMSSGSSMYSMSNSSQATIRPSDAVVPEKEPGKEKKHHHFLSRQKQKLSGKDDHHLLLSSAKSNSMPVDPNAPSMIYNFGAPPPSPGPSGTSFSKSMSGLDLRHGGRALREKKKEEKNAANHSFQESGLRESEINVDWAGPSSYGSANGPSMPNPYMTSIYGGDAADLGRYGLQNMGVDDAWPLLKSKILVAFQGEALRMPVEDLNRLVTTHIQHCIRKRLPNMIIDDFRDLITTGFKSIEPKLRGMNDEQLIPQLVRMWDAVFCSLLNFLQAVFLPLDLEFEGHGPLMSPKVARDFWGALPLSSVSNGGNSPMPVPAHYLLSVRRIVLTTYRDIMILPRFELLHHLCSRMSLNNIFPSSPSPNQLYSGSPPDGRPGTAASLDPAFSSFNSTTTTLLNGSLADGESHGSRSRGISNVSFSSDQRDAVYAHATANSRGGNATTSQRDLNEEEAMRVTETVGRMLQCMSVLSSVGIIPGDGSEVRAQREAAAARGATAGGGRARGYSTGMVEDVAAQEKIDRLCKALKLNWLGRGRTGRNRKGFVGAKMKTSMPTVG